MYETIYAFPKIKDIDPSCYIDAYNLVLECSKAHTPRSFAIKLLDLLAKVSPYDQAMVFFMDANGKLSGKYTINVDEKWVDEYLNYYLDFTYQGETCMSIFQDVKETPLYSYSRTYDWSQFPLSEFRTDYIEGRGLKYSWGFCFFDLNGDYRVIFSLDRTSDRPFTDTECNRLNLAMPILNNMHRNFFYQGMDTKEDCMIQSPWKEYDLTVRETEIANLLCQGMSVQNISSALFIAVTTTYKHISHIYEKMDVKSQQELLVKMLNHKRL